LTPLVVSLLAGPAAALGHGEDADQRELAVSVRQALGRLSPRQRAVLVLRYTASPGWN
jgi:DNA-directed RNA polymerase specialized sigma24 family protein